MSEFILNNYYLFELISNNRYMATVIAGYALAIICLGWLIWRSGR